MAMATSMLSGCGVKSDTPVVGGLFGLSSDEVFQIKDLVCSEEEFKLVLMNMANNYKKGFGDNLDWNSKIKDDLTMKDYIMNKVKQEISSKYAMASMAKDKGVKLDTEEKIQAEYAANTYYKSLTNEEKEYTNAKKEDVERLYQNYMLADKIYDKLTVNIDEQVSDEEARVIKIQYIKMTDSGNKADEIKSTLEKVRSGVKKGTKSFDSYVSLYNEDEESDKTIKKNEAQKKYELKAFTLSNDKVSNIIEDGNDYYLVYCVDSYDKQASEKNKQSLIKQKKIEFFKQNYNDFIKKSKNDFNTDCFEGMDVPKGENIKRTDLFEVYKKKTEE